MNYSDKIRRFGFKEVISGSQRLNVSFRPLKDIIIENLESFPEVISMLDDEDICYSIIEYVYDNDKDQELLKPLSSFIEKTTAPDMISIASIMSWNDKAGQKLKLLSMIKEFDWKDLFDQSVSWVADRRFYGENLKVVLKQAAIQHPDHFLSVVQDKIFGAKPFAYHVREVFYPAIISAGLLDTKMARKMRSDASESASLCAVRELLTCTDQKYPNIDQLLVTFSDSKHQYVIRELADNMPKHLLSSLLGTQFQWLKPNIEKRMQKDEE